MKRAVWPATASQTTPPQRSGTSSRRDGLPPSRRARRRPRMMPRMMLRGRNTQCPLLAGHCVEATRARLPGPRLGRLLLLREQRFGEKKGAPCEGARRRLVPAREGEDDVAENVVMTGERQGNVRARAELSGAGHEDFPRRLCLAEDPARDRELVRLLEPSRPGKLDRPTQLAVVPGKERCPLFGVEGTRLAQDRRVD
jgi:hypothetical protein